MIEGLQVLRVVRRVHDIFTGIVALFDRMGLQTNMAKRNVLIYTPGYLRGEQEVIAYKRIVTWQGVPRGDVIRGYQNASSVGPVWHGVWWGCTSRAPMGG